MNHYVDAFLKQVLEQVRYKKIHSQLAQELNDHIESIKEMLMEEQGYDEEKAYEEAVKQMGEATEIGEGLHKMHKPRVEWSIMLLIVSLLGIGLWTLAYYGNYSEPGFTETWYLSRQLFTILLGCVGFMGVYFIDYKYIKKFSLVLYCATLALLALIRMFGCEIMGAKSWLMIGPIQLNARILSPFLIVGYVGLVNTLDKKNLSGEIICLLLAVLPFPFYMRGNIDLDMQGSINLGLIICIVLLVTYYRHDPNCLKLVDNKKYNLLILLGIVITSTILIAVKEIITVPHRLDRIKAWIDPMLDPGGNGYLVLQLRNMCKGASLLGNGGINYTLSQVGSDELVLPYPYGATEYIFNFIIGGLGILVAALLVIVIAGLLIRCFKATFKVREGYGHELLFAISLFLTLQFLFNLLINLGLLPFFGGTYMPFVSYGGMNMVSNMMLMGFFLGIYRRKDINPSQLIASQDGNEESINKIYRC